MQQPLDNGILQVAGLLQMGSTCLDRIPHSLHQRLTFGTTLVSLLKGSSEKRNELSACITVPLSSLLVQEFDKHPFSSTADIVA